MVVLLEKPKTTTTTKIDWGVFFSPTRPSPRPSLERGRGRDVHDGVGDRALGGSARGGLAPRRGAALALLPLAAAPPLQRPGPYYPCWAEVRGFPRTPTPASQANKGVRRAGSSCSGLLPSLLAAGLRPHFGALHDPRLGSTAPAPGRGRPPAAASCPAGRSCPSSPPPCPHRRSGRSPSP